MIVSILADDRSVGNHKCNAELDACEKIVVALMVYGHISGWSLSAATLRTDSFQTPIHVAFNFKMEQVVRVHVFPLCYCRRRS